ncbi:hypothetical protein [Lysinibacillus xylanilyticus]|uniref:hypothetical protein n=1 Tax=Lysinibacillus xylanilyticus TaxID=582475 RepID=UPI00381D3C1C
MTESVTTGTEVSHLYRWWHECDLSYFSAGVQTTTEIEELSLRTPRPVARLSDQHHVGPKPGGCHGIMPRHN